jgi:tRNA (guanine37-N1)-methyltransferase
MRFTVITAFPDFFRDFLSVSIVGRAVATGLLDVRCVDLRTFGEGNYRKIDDYAFGTGGMVLMPAPLDAALKSARDPEAESELVVYPSPQGVPLSQEIVGTLASRRHIIILCGHYEGIDERFAERRVDLEVSVGDFVLTGGEIPAMTVIDAVARLIPGVVGRAEAVREDSFFRGMLDHPHYTRPAVWEGFEVPEILLSGNTAAIAAWRRSKAAERTLARRPDLLSRANIVPYLKKGLYVALLYDGAADPDDESSAPALMELNLPDAALSCRTFGVKRVFVVSSIASLRKSAQALKERWTAGSEMSANHGYALAFERLRLMPSLERTVRWIEDKVHETPFVIGIGAREHERALPWLLLKRRALEEDRPILLLFSAEGAGHSDPGCCDAVMEPISGGEGDYSCLSMRSVLSIVLDRFAGRR